MAISDNIFEKCIPAYGTDIRRCGTVTACDVGLPTDADLDNLFKDPDGNFIIPDALFMQDFEIKSCQSKVNGLYDFLMANKVKMTDRITTSKLGNGLYEIQPFIQAKQKSIINNKYWTVSNGSAAGAGDWRVDVASQNSIPVDARWFAVDDRVFIFGESAGGTKTTTAWRVLSSTVVGSVVRLELASENAASNLEADQLENPETGVMIRGTPNVNDYEEFCDQIPGLNVNKLVPFWIETTRNALCVDEQYEKYQKLVRENNSYYRMFGDIESVELNKQIGQDFQERWVNTFFFNKPLANQDMTNYTSLEEITVPTTALNIPDEGRCVGRRANAIGIYEQLAECGRVFDLQGQVLNLAELHDAIYQLLRVREAQGLQTSSIDLFTDSFYAKQIENAYINYFRAKAGGDFRLTWDVKAKTTAFGFKFKSIELDWPVVTLNLVSHKFFDDQVSAHQAVFGASASSGRSVWLLEFSGIYPGIITSNRKVLRTGELEELARVDSSYTCRMNVPKLSRTLTSITWTAILECPAANMVLENISSDVPEHEGASGDEDDLYGEFTSEA